MSNDTQKADQIAYKFYTKLTLVVNTARASTDPRSPTKTDRWFNLETPDSDLFKDHLRVYRSVSVSPHPPPFELQVLLSIPELAHNQVLVHLAPDSSRVRIEPTPTHILLESWLLSFNSSPYPLDDQVDVAPSTIYKHGIPLFRSIYSLLRILPAWKVSKRLHRRTGGSNRSGVLSIQLRVPALDEHSDGVLGFNTAPAQNATPLPNETHMFPSIPHPTGTLTLSVTYLTTPNFQLDELESLLSSRFLSLDTGPEFTPTLAKNQQRDSLTVSRGSLPTKIAVPPKSSPSVADKFILPSRVASLGSSPRNSPLSLARFPSAATESGISIMSREDSRPPSGVPARLRKESLNLVSDLPSVPTPTPLPIRRPNINPVHPFKASTLSSGSTSHHSPSTSLRQPSPLSSIGMPSLPSRPVQPPTPTSPTSARIPLPMGPRASPPFTPSSLGDRRSLTSADGDRDRDDGLPKPLLPGRKRYSSSFGHRYAASVGAGSEGSAGSGERREGERAGNASFLSTNTDDDDISVFVQDIDSRKPLSGRLRTLEQDTTQDQDQDSNTREGGNEYSIHHSGIRDGGSAEGSSQGPILTNEDDVNEELRRLNAAFHASLEGLGSGRKVPRSAEVVRPQRLSEAMERRPRSAGSGGGGSDVVNSRDSRGRGGMLLASHSRRSRNTSLSSVGIGQGSEEIIGRLELDDAPTSSPRRRGD